MAAKRKPVWKEDEERERRKVSNRVRARQQPGRRRLRVEYDVNGPRVRLGIGWFVLNVVALVLGLWTLALLYAGTAAIAALQTAMAWSKTGRHPHRVVTGVGAAAIGLAGAVSTGMVGLVILIVVAAASFVAYSERDRPVRRGHRDPIVDASFTIRCALYAGFAAACVSIAARFEFGAAVGLVLVVAAYETGDYLVGSGASNPYEGPIAGATAIVVVTFAITALGIEPFAFPRAFLFGFFAAVLCPLGQLLASAILPSAKAPASALRRIDSLLLLAPVWALATGLVV
jgi:hypothetical protein